MATGSITSNESESLLLLLQSCLHFFVRALEFFVRFFKLCDLCIQVCIFGVLLMRHISVAWVALHAPPCEGFFGVLFEL